LTVFKLSPLPRNVEAALRDAGHRDVKVRMSALKDLSVLARGPERKRVLECLGEMLTRDDSEEVRAAVAVALADAQADSAVPSLIQAAREAPPKVRQMALMALGELARGVPEAFEVVRVALEEGDAALRFQALVAQFHLRPEETIASLERHLKDSDPEIRAVAVRIADEHFTDRRPSDAPRWLVRSAKRLCRDEAPEVSLLAAILSQRLTGKTDPDPIAAAVNRRAGVKDPADEQAAIEIAGELAIGAARSGLERRAFGFMGFSTDAFAWQARVALARMGHARAAQGILNDLASTDRDKRALAVAAAGAARLAAARARLLSMLGDEQSAEPDEVRKALARIDGEANERS
jgi:HEAT repeat protein